MNHVFWGLLLIFLNFNITIGDSMIGILPDFAGFILIVLGLKELVEESAFFTKAILFAKGMVVYSIILYSLDLFGLARTLSWFTTFAGIIATIVSLYISYNIIQGILDVEGKYSVDLNGENLLRLWKPLAVLELLAYVSLLMPMLAVVFIVASFVLTIMFMVCFYTTKNNYMQI